MAKVPTVNIVLITEDMVTHEQFEEAWIDYIDLTEEDAIEEINRVMSNFNNTLRPYENPREPVSFVLEDSYYVV